MNLQELTAGMNNIAREAGLAIRQVSLAPRDVELKGDGSPVTVADKKAHTIILEGLQALTPSITVISEEGALDDLTGEGPREYWLVDPLDGTKEFIKGNGEYTVNIALVREGVPVLASVYVPAFDTLYWALEGGGAWKEDEGTTGEPLRLNAGGSSDPVTAVVSRSHPSPETDAFLANLPVRHRVERGSSVKLCAVAEGTADIYVRMNPTYLWDTAAGAIVAREAGAMVVDREGNDLSYSLTNDLKQKGFIVFTPSTCALDFPA